MRYVFNRFAEALEIIIHPERYLRLDDDLILAIHDLVDNSRVGRWRTDDKNKQITPKKVAADAVRLGIEVQWNAEREARTWDNLTPREQHVAALVCLGYSNKEIAGILMVAHSTVKSHVRNILMKFRLNGKLELKGVLRDWDFSAWENIKVNQDR